MKKFITISLVFMGLLSSCSDTDMEIIDHNEAVEITVEKTYTIAEYYEEVEPIIANRTDGSLKVGREIFQLRNRKKVIDTLTIDLTKAPYYFDKLSFGILSYSQPSSITNEYSTINYLNIIGLDNFLDLKIVFNDEYYDDEGVREIKINNSNVSVDYLNTISYGRTDLKKAAFKKIELNEQDVRTFQEFSDGSYTGGFMYQDFFDKEVGYMGVYSRVQYEIIDIVDN